MAYFVNRPAGPTGYYSKNVHVGEDDEDDDPTVLGSNAALQKGNAVHIWGNVNTLNINPLIVTNIQGSPYFKVKLIDLKTYHEVIDEIYYRVEHLEPWERGSRVRQ